MTDPLYLGCISGTSMDGLDLAVLRCPVAGSPDAGLPTLVAAGELPLPDDLRQLLRRLATADGDTVQALGAADAALGNFIGTGIRNWLPTVGLVPSDIAAIGSHGQTVRHCPDDPDHGWTLQIGDANRIAAITGLPVVADFRRADMAAGGQGAPLVPAFHHALLQDDTGCQVLNLGGIANVTVLPPMGSAEPVRGFDTGPANTLMDAWFRQHHPGHADGFDRDGAWAASGTVVPGLLQHILGEPWLQQPPPRSTGPELFNLAWLQHQCRAAGCTDAAAADIQATLASYTAATVADALSQHGGGTAGPVLLCGGGAHNKHLQACLAARMPGAELATLADRLPAPEGPGTWGDAMEAAAFAWLAWCWQHGRAGNVPAVTGAAGPRVLGACWPAPEAN